MDHLRFGFKLYRKLVPLWFVKGLAKSLSSRGISIKNILVSTLWKPILDVAAAMYTRWMHLGEVSRVEFDETLAKLRGELRKDLKKLKKE